MRSNNRSFDQLRPTSITPQFIKYAEGSVLVQYGNTQVICTASFVEGVPRFLKGKGVGWLTAEYGMLPRATSERTEREAARGKQTGRTQEIQRLIGRSLRQAIDMTALGENTLMIDCDVIQADGGTRTASITGSCVAVALAGKKLLEQKKILKNPLKFLIASVSVGIYKNVPLLDLDYEEDSNAETDMNVVLNEQEEFIEIQGTAERTPFKQDQLNAMLELAKKGGKELIELQKKVI